MQGWTQLELIKTGGQADIYRAESDSGGRGAIKVLRLSQNPEEQAEQRQRFDREVKCHLSLDHPGIMPILTADLTGDEPSFVMPLGSRSLRAAIEPVRTSR